MHIHLTAPPSRESSRTSRRLSERGGLVRWSGALASLLLLATYACSAGLESEEDLGSVENAVTTISITGTVKDGAAKALAGVTVTLAGKASKTTTTNAYGKYSFTGLATGSYSVKPTKQACSFTPDVANLNNLAASKTQNFVGSCVTPTSRKYMALIYNPVLENRNGVRLVTYLNANDSDTLASQYVADLKTASWGLAKYTQAARAELDEYPVHEDGYQYTDDTFVACLDDPTRAACHKPGQEDGFGYAIDYGAMLQKNRICERFNNQEFDELWMFGAPFMGFWEANQAGTTAIVTNGPVVTTSTCQGRLNIMGFNYQRGMSEMLENYGHRSEGTLRGLLPNWGSLFYEYMRYDAANPGQAQCGWMHWAPNSAFGYDWGNKAYVPSGCEDWLNYPNRTGAMKSLNCDAWGCDARQHKIWWLSHLPHATGTATDGSSNNWWSYLLIR